MKQEKIENIIKIALLLSLPVSGYVGHYIGEFRTLSLKYKPTPTKFNYDIKIPQISEKILFYCQGEYMTLENIKSAIEIKEKLLHQASYNDQITNYFLSEFFSYTPITQKTIKAKGIEATLSEAPIIEKIECKPKDELK